MSPFMGRNVPVYGIFLKSNVPVYGMKFLNVPVYGMQFLKCPRLWDAVFIANENRLEKLLKQ